MTPGRHPEAGWANPETHTYSTDNLAFDGAYVITMKLMDGDDAEVDGHVFLGTDGGQGLM
jgi:hypothetical protein